MFRPSHAHVFRRQPRTGVELRRRRPEAAEQVPDAMLLASCCEDATRFASSVPPVLAKLEAKTPGGSQGETQHLRRDDPG